MAFEVIKDRNYKIEDLGEIALKGIHNEVPVYRLV
jgi:class 3 adenylate cyclase